MAEKKKGGVAMDRRNLYFHTVVGLDARDIGHPSGGVASYNISGILNRWGQNGWELESISYLPVTEHVLNMLANDGRRQNAVYAAAIVMVNRESTLPKAIEEAWNMRFGNLEQLESYLRHLFPARALIRTDSDSRTHDAMLVVGDTDGVKFHLKQGGEQTMADIEDDAREFLSEVANWIATLIPPPPAPQSVPAL